MAKYTTQLRSICEVNANISESGGYSDVNEIISKAIPKIFNFDFPIFDENYRFTIEKKILKHYYTREIGFETFGLWKLKLDTKLNEIMPYYNQLYKSALIEYNPLYDTDVTTEHTGNRNETRKNHDVINGNYSDSNAADSNGMNVFSDTPQGGLTDVINNAYLTNATKTNSHTEGVNSGNNTTESNGNGTIDGTDNYIEHIFGSRSGVSLSQKISDFRKTILNIDMQVIDELKDLFFLLW